MMNSGLTIVLLLTTFGLSAFSHSFPQCCRSIFCELKNKLDAINQVCSSSETTCVHLSGNGTECCESLTNELNEKRNASKNLCGECPTVMIFPEKNTVDYARSDGAPEMNAFTMCLWVKPNQTPINVHYISYAVRKADNQILLYTPENSAKLRLTIHHDGKSRDIDSSKRPAIAIVVGQWNHFCVTWRKSNGEYFFYKNGRKVGDGTISASVGIPIPGDGTWVLRQDQDKVGGGFQAHQSATGKLSGVNIWNRILNDPEIMEMSRSVNASGQAAGNVKSWYDFICGARGNVIFGND